jgi:hypothetical protein
VQCCLVGCSKLSTVYTAALITFLTFRDLEYFSRMCVQCALHSKLQWIGEASV